MIEILVPGGGALRLEYLVADFNGTLAVDATLLPGVDEALRRLAGRLAIHVVTADTHGRAREALAGLPLELFVLPPGPGAPAKRYHVERLGAHRCAAIGNGRNDCELLSVAALGIAVMQAEGAAAQTLAAADIVVPDIGAALDLLLHPARLASTLRP